MEASRVLALDLSGHVGWAFYASRDARPIFDTWHAPERRHRDVYGPLFAAFEDWLCDQIHKFKPLLIGFEAPILPRVRVFQKQRAIRISYGLAEITERIAYQRRIRCVEVHPSTVKVRLAGRGNAKKHHMVLAANKLGLEVTSDHEADAIGVALATMDHVDPPQHEMAWA